MGQKCAQCGKVWALRKPDPDGIFRCMRHTQQPQDRNSGRKTDISKEATRYDSRDKIIDFLSSHAAASSAREAAGIAKAMIAAVQMVDPMAPEQELGVFRILRVTAQVTPALEPHESEPIQADAE